MPAISRNDGREQPQNQWKNKSFMASGNTIFTRVAAKPPVFSVSPAATQSSRSADSCSGACDAVEVKRLGHADAAELRRGSLHSTAIQRAGRCVGLHWRRISDRSGLQGLGELLLRDHAIVVPVDGVEGGGSDAGHHDCSEVASEAGLQQCYEKNTKAIS
eukprot:TRINITY_DN3394_c0_g1_i13.p1 TRINITY_DN3394_c0_g1~~TRINITY_DN3394_c0_g1_i13.p1  ORF type:complete len:160 (-),score=14.02 TRINITY_DN3394_c0_g1_i13:2-481(-)